MALINCPECNKEISDQANSCPECGYVLKPLTAKNKVNYKFILIGVVVLVFILAVIGIKRNQSIKIQEELKNRIIGDWEATYLNTSDDGEGYPISKFVGAGFDVETSLKVDEDKFVITTHGLNDKGEWQYDSEMDEYSLVAPDATYIVTIDENNKLHLDMDTGSGNIGEDYR